MSLQTLNESTLATAVQTLTERDARLAEIVRDFGPPPLWPREPGFPTLLHIILEQQVSLASAKAAFDRLQEAVNPVTPEGFLQLSDLELKTIGFSRQKTRYGRLLAEEIRTGKLDLAALDRLPDEAVRSVLTALTGIGNWTADIYLLMALRRPDVWPKGDLALAVAMQQLKNLTSRPTFEELEALSLQWKPWRAVAARLLWHLYLSRRG
jgi:DNA-3-methyladenine glycosylase II